MKLQNVSITIIIMAMIVLGITSFISDLGGNYGAADFTGLENTEHRLGQQVNLSIELEEDISSITLQADDNAFLIPYNLIKAGWHLTKLMFSPFWTFGAIISDVSDASSSLGIPLPVWLVVSIKAMLWITLAAILIFAFFKWKFED